MATYFFPSLSHLSEKNALLEEKGQFVGKPKICFKPLLVFCLPFKTPFPGSPTVYSTYNFKNILKHHDLFAAS